MRSFPEYQVWADVIKRCENPKHSQYKDYGGRGIGVCDRWRFDFSKFYEDLGPRPEGATIERRDVNTNYCPDNCHWELDRGVQSFNTTLHGSNKSGKAGVMWDSQRGLWQSFIYKDKKKYFLGRFSELNEAILARKAGEMLHYGFHKSA
jgi:hypothetical protein